MRAICWIVFFSNINIWDVSCSSYEDILSKFLDMRHPYFDTEILLIGCNMSDPQIQQMEDNCAKEIIKGSNRTNACLLPSTVSRPSDLQLSFSVNTVIFSCDAKLTWLRSVPDTGYQIDIVCPDCNMKQLEDVTALGQNLRKFFFKEDEQMFVEVITKKALFDKVTFTEPVLEYDLPSTNLHGLSLKVGYIEAASYLGYIPDKQFTQSIGGIFEIMKKTMNFTYIAIPSKDGFYGAKISNTKWNGLIGMLIDKECDLVLTDLSLTFSRIQVADFGGGIMIQPYVSIIGTASDSSMQWSAYVSALKSNILLSFLGTALALMVVLLILHLFAARDKRYPDGHWVNILKYWNDTGGEILSFSYTSMLNQDNFLLENLHKNRYLWTLRVLMLTLLVFGYIFMTIYNAELTASLTSKEKKLPIQIFTDIIGTSYNMAIMESSSAVTLFEESTGILQRIWKEKIEGKEYGQVSWVGDKQLLKALENNYILLGYGNAAEDFIARNPCKAAKLPVEAMMGTQVGMFLRKNSPFTPLFRNQLNRLREMGVVDTLIINSNRERPKNSGCGTTELALGIPNTIFLYVFVGVGGAVSLIVAILEIIVNKMDKQRLLADGSYKEEEQLDPAEHLGEKGATQMGKRFVLPPSTYVEQLD